MRLITTAAVLFLISFLAATPVRAEDSEVTGARLIAALRDNAARIRDLVISGDMLTHTRGGRESKRKFELRLYSRPALGEFRIWFTFIWPEDIRGTALLVHTVRGAPTRTWVYLPAIKMVREVASPAQVPILGRDFELSNFVLLPLEDIHHFWRRDEPCAGDRVCRVIDGLAGGASGVLRQRFWLDAERNHLHVAERYDEGGKLTRSVAFDGYKKSLAGYWWAETVETRDHVTGTVTRVIWQNFIVNQGLARKDFSISAFLAQD